VEEKEGRVRQVFDSVADSYDVMNDVMSAGLHRFWKDFLLRESGAGALAAAARRSNAEFGALDVAGGTGDVAFRLVEAAGCLERSKSTGADTVSVTVCDINDEMLRVGERRARTRYGDALLDGTRALRFVRGNAEKLQFDDDSFDLYTIAFGLRNVTDVDQALQEACRVLKPGGRYMCLEFSHVTNPVLAAAYDAYSFHVIPELGDWVAGDRASYRYLVESIRRFPAQEELAQRMRSAGMDGVSYTNMTGGIVALHTGYKPF
jgi:ubiquinone/menaquinone biosynthesis methyltransferase